MNRWKQKPLKLQYAPKPASEIISHGPALAPPQIQLALHPKVEMQVIHHFTASFIQKTMAKLPGFEPFLTERQKQADEDRRYRRKTELRLLAAEENAAEMEERCGLSKMHRQMKKLELIFREQESLAQELREEFILEERRLQKERTEEIRREVLKESSKEVNFLVQKSMKEQIHILTDKVYGRMESRLRDEMRRRGR